MIKPDDYIVTAWAQYTSGGNCPVIVIVRDTKTMELREEFLQPHEQTREIDTLFNVSASVSDSMRLAVRRAVKHPPKRRKGPTCPT